MICCDPKFSPAAFRHRVTIQTLTLTATDTGGRTEAWSNFATVWASLEPKLTREVVFGEKLETRVTHIIRMRYLAGVTTDKRILFDNRTFQIKAVIIPDEIKEYLQIEAMEFTGT
jgi:SPP1 family predicted phage head-tail adaptor